MYSGLSEALHDTFRAECEDLNSLAVFYAIAYIDTLRAVCEDLNWLDVVR